VTPGSGIIEKQDGTGERDRSATGRYMPPIRYYVGKEEDAQHATPAPKQQCHDPARILTGGCSRPQTSGNSEMTDSTFRPIVRSVSLG
jgi:hypothetical protein